MGLAGTRECFYLYPRFSAFRECAYCNRGTNHQPKNDTEALATLYFTGNPRLDGACGHRLSKTRKGQLL